MFEIKLGRPAIILAPMEGVTDAPMRALLSAIGGFDFCVSEFLRVSQLVPPAKTFLRHVPELASHARTPAGTPVQIQLLGGDPGRLAESAHLAAQLGAPGIDLNFGCPAPTVNRHDGGATLLKFPARIRAIVSAVRAAVPAHLPVSAKLRLGWDDPTVVLQNAAQACEGGASWVTIHARTKTQGYRPPAYWDALSEVRRLLPIPVVANGEIWSIEDWRRCREVTGCEHFMLGRGALADPFLALRIRGEWAGGLETNLPHAADLAKSETWIPLVERFIARIQLEPKANGYAVSRVKQWFNLARSRRELTWWDRLKLTTSVDDLLLALQA